MQQNDDIMATIGRINPPMLELTKLLDRIPVIYARGTQVYKDELEQLLQCCGLTSEEPRV